MHLMHLNNKGAFTILMFLNHHPINRLTFMNKILNQHVAVSSSDLDLHNNTRPVTGSVTTKRLRTIRYRQIVYQESFAPPPKKKQQKKQKKKQKKNQTKKNCCSVELLTRYHHPSGFCILLWKPTGPKDPLIVHIHFIPAISGRNLTIKRQIQNQREIGQAPTCYVSVLKSIVSWMHFYQDDTV